jgi:hypothetical protein
MVDLLRTSNLPLLAIWAIFMISALPTNLVWLRIARAVSSQGVAVRLRPLWHLTVVRQFQELMEQDKTFDGRQHRRLLLAWRILFTWSMLLFAAFIGAAIVRAAA